MAAVYKPGLVPSLSLRPPGPRLPVPVFKLWPRATQAQAFGGPVRGHWRRLWQCFHGERGGPARRYRLGPQPRNLTLAT